MVHLPTRIDCIISVIQSLSVGLCDVQYIRPRGPYQSLWQLVILKWLQFNCKKESFESMSGLPSDENPLTFIWLPVNSCSGPPQSGYRDKGRHIKYLEYMGKKLKDHQILEKLKKWTTSFLKGGQKQEYLKTSSFLSGDWANIVKWQHSFYSPESITKVSSWPYSPSMMIAVMYIGLLACCWTKTDYVFFTLPLPSCLWNPSWGF